MKAQYSDVPAGFSRAIVSEALAADKLNRRRVKYDGDYFTRGCSPPEIFKRWNRCEDLAYKSALKAHRLKQGKCSHMSQEEILQGVLERVSSGRHGSPEELKWITRRVAELLKWPVPRGAK